MYVEWYQDVLCHIIIRPIAIHKGSRNYCCIYRFGKLVVILGGFHLLVSYLGADGFIIGGSGLETLWETVYPSGSVIHMMTGHAYCRTVRAHLLTSVALHAMLLSTHEHLNDEDQRKRLFVACTSN